MTKLQLNPVRQTLGDYLNTASDFEAVDAFLRNECMNGKKKLYNDIGKNEIPITIDNIRNVAAMLLDMIDRTGISHISVWDK